ncbi:MAG: histidinol-phosphatase HisJ family protein [Lachnospiraceae bacterium]|nr:histidinol-phosphatase HisJ family protein [Lachnospiraceae bacterium]
MEKRMIDGHIHIERGEYSLDWIQRFVDRAVETGLTEIRLLEHNFLFPEYAPMYDSVRVHSEFVDAWFRRVGGTKDYAEYLRLIEKVRGEHWPVKILFGLEVCYFKDFEDLIAEFTKDRGFDFLLGSVHFAGDFAFDHTAEHWEGLDVDEIFRTYFEDSLSLAKSGLFTGIGHPDHIKLFGHRPSFSLAEYYEKLACELEKAGMYADQNSGAFRRCPETGELGMNPELLRTLVRHNVRIVTSSDAHRPEDVGYRIKELGEAVAAAGGEKLCN